MLEGGKRKINMLMNIDNYFGEHHGRLGPPMVFLLVSAAPFLLYAFLLQWLIPLKAVIVFEILWIVRVALLILGRENEKLRQFRIEQYNVYATADQIINVEYIQPDGLIEYSNGSVAYILSGFFMDYMDDDSFTIDVQKFLEQLRGLDFDIYSHMVVDELRLQSNSRNLTKYRDTDMVRERLAFYKVQDRYCEENSELYRINIVVSTGKYNWKTLKARLDKLVLSDYARCWRELRICDDKMVEDVMSRDLCLDVDILGMLVSKYKNEEYFGSEVLFYGDNIPDECSREKDCVMLSERRVVNKEKR